MIRNIISKTRKKIQQPILNTIYSFLMSPAKNFKGRRLFGAEELALLHRALIDQNLYGVGGRMVTAFEQQFAHAYGVPYAVASSSGTAAIHTALGAININPGDDEVITAPITDLGTIIPIINQGAIPVFADIDDSYNMDPKDVAKKITPRTKAIIVVHLFGNPCDMDAMVEIAQTNKIALIEDSCQSHMTEYKGKLLGTIGDIGCFSFQQSKAMATGDGGMTITNNQAYYEHMKMFVDKGWARKGWGPRAYKFHGQNYRMNELTAAVGIAQLKKVKNVVTKRNEYGEYLTQLLSDVDGIRTCPVTPGSKHAYWLYPIYFESTDLERLEKELRKENVYGSIGYTVKPIYLCAESLTGHKTYGNSQYPFSWKDVNTSYEYKEGLCPKAEDTLKHLFCIFPNECWTRQQIEKTAESIRKVCLLMSDVSGEKPAQKSASKSAPITSASPKTKKVRIGIVGCGLMGNLHASAYNTNPDVEIGGYVDTDYDKARNMPIRSKANFYTSHKEMFANEPLDGVSICTVPSTHKEIVMDALEAGVNVLCEKPLAVSVSQAQEMTKKAEQKDKLLLTAFKFRFFEEVQQAKKILEQGHLGKIIHFRVMFGGYLDMSGTWYANKEISGGGVLMDNGPHAIDLVRYLLGDIKDSFAQFNQIQNLSVEDTALLSLVLENGASGTVDISWSTPIPAQNYMEIYGENGVILLDFKGISYRFKTWNEFKRIQNKLTGNEAFASQLNHFVRSIQNGKTIIIQNDDGLKTQEIIEPFYRNEE